MLEDLEVGILSTNNVLLTGIFPTIPTPFNVDGSINISKFQKNLLRNRDYCSGYVVHGSNGEAVFLTPSERILLVQKSRELVSREHLLIVGSGMESTSDTINLTKKIADSGADAVLILTPHFYKKSFSLVALERYYNDVANATAVPIILYNAPVFTSIDLPVTVVQNLANHPNIIGIKESTGDKHKIKQMVDTTPDDFAVLTGSFTRLLDGLTVGASGGILGMANIVAKHLSEILDAVSDGNLRLAHDIHQFLIPLSTELSRKCGISGLKAVLNIIDECGGEVRAPLLPLTSSDKEELMLILRRYDLT